MREAELAGLIVDLQKFYRRVISLVQAGFFYTLQALPSDLADVEQTFLARHKLYEAAVRHNANDFCIINLAYFRHGYDGADLGYCGINAFFARSADLDLAYAVFFFDSNRRAGFFLHALDDFSARADNGADKLFRNLKGNDAGHVGLEVGTRLSQRFGELSEDVFATCLSLHQGFFQDFIGKTIALDVHLRCRQTVDGAGRLEVHITQVVLIAKYVGEDRILLFAGVFD